MGGFVKVTQESVNEIDVNEFNHFSTKRSGVENSKQVNLLTEIHINPSLLIDEKLNQPKKFLWWRRALAHAKLMVKEAKDKRARTYSSLIKLAKDTLTPELGKKPSEIAIDSFIINHPSYISANSEYRQAVKYYDDIDAIVESLRQRFEILTRMTLDDVKYAKDYTD